MSNWDGAWVKMKHFKWTSTLYWKIKIKKIADMWLIPLDRAIYFVLPNKNQSET